MRKKGISQSLKYWQTITSHTLLQAEKREKGEIAYFLSLAAAAEGINFEKTILKLPVITWAREPRQI